MCRVGKKPETRARARVFSLPEPDPSPTFNTRPIPETRHATRGYPPGTRLGKICWFFAKISKNLALFTISSKFLAIIFRQIFEIFAYTQWNFRNFWLFSDKFSKFLAIFAPKFRNLSKFTQPNTRRVPGYPRLCTRARPGGYRHYPSPTRTRPLNTRTHPKPDFLLPGASLLVTFITRSIISY